MTLISATSSPVPRCLCGAYAIPAQWFCSAHISPQNIGTDDVLAAEMSVLRKDAESQV